MEGGGDGAPKFISGLYNLIWRLTIGPLKLGAPVAAGAAGPSNRPRIRYKRSLWMLFFSGAGRHTDYFVWEIHAIHKQV